MQSTEDSINILMTIQRSEVVYIGRPERDALTVAIEAIRRLAVLQPMLKRIEEQLPKPVKETT